MMWVWMCCVLMCCCLSGESHHHSRGRRAAVDTPQEEASATFWQEKAQETLRRHLEVNYNTNVAKNVILFLGDGMSIPTLAAARIYKGQLEGRSGEDELLSFEQFPFVGLSKTYCVDSQVADSACSATAYLGGVKANEGTLGVTAAVKRRDCVAMNNASHHVLSIAHWAQQAGMATGLVTTTRVTHASPAGLYAHSADRDWEDDKSIASDKQDPSSCMDIAQQLVLQQPGSNLNVILGGGRRQFYPAQGHDHAGVAGKRRDGQDLIKMWMDDKLNKKAKFAYITTKDQLPQEDGGDLPDYLLGLFAPSHLKYHLDAPEEQPTLQEMTESAIRILSKSANGFFLFVEGGKIDHGHHENLAKKAVDETVEFSKAVDSALNMTDEHNTLVVVTSDHAHVMTFNGDPKRGTSIFGMAGKGTDKRAYTTLSYTNGPGYRKPDSHGNRVDVSHMKTDDKGFKFPTMVPLSSETHGGDDVAVFARGPWAHLFTGSFEQNFIPHGLGYASCLGQGLTACSGRHSSLSQTDGLSVQPLTLR